MESICLFSQCFCTLEIYQCFSSLSPVLTVPVLPRFATVTTSRYTVINRGIIPTKIDRVLTVTVLPRCSPGFGPGSTTVSSRYRPLCPGFTMFTTVASRFIPVCRGGVPVQPGVDPMTAGPATVLPRCLPVLKMLATGVNRDATGAKWDATG